MSRLTRDRQKRQMDKANSLGSFRKINDQIRVSADDDPGSQVRSWPLAPVAFTHDPIKTEAWVGTLRFY